MKNIVLTRIDDRLLHGQVVVSWIPYLKINEIIIVDDEYAKDEFMATIIKDAAPDNLAVQVLAVNEAADYLGNYDDGSRVLILSRYIENISELIELNVPINKVNIGGLGNTPGRKRFLNSIHLSDDELNILKDLKKKNIEVEIKMLPNDKALFVE
ncbi:MAG: PTS sugar transporter subunit IIB [Sedimentibacter sp.]|uniref:PTS sugar transporter subunit IIB n=1 Tax=Sedimentibacter sp. TaxID=1960295 RepID=UPI002980D4D9|nr:PTS sugar transporter subunit IIB [Sedimentibacter sp.]MDW5300554.1 PTS sugar transporter subunit IIB [Sedimentibacter sp.]